MILFFLESSIRFLLIIMKLQIKNSLILTVNPQNEVLENADIAILILMFAKI